MRILNSISNTIKYIAIHGFLLVSIFAFIFFGLLPILSVPILILAYAIDAIELFNSENNYILYILLIFISSLGVLIFLLRGTFGKIILRNEQTQTNKGKINPPKEGGVTSLKNSEGSTSTQKNTTPPQPKFPTANDESLSRSQISEIDALLRKSVTDRAPLKSKKTVHKKTTQKNAADIIQKEPLEVRKVREKYDQKLQSGAKITDFGREFSPLKYYGYTVGKTNGRSAKTRIIVLQYVLVADLPENIFPTNYRSLWGEPGSNERYDRIVSHISHQIELREFQNRYSTAIEHWATDLKWLRDEKARLIS